MALAMNPPMQVSSSSSLMSLATTSSQERAPAKVTTESGNFGSSGMVGTEGSRFTS